MKDENKTTVTTETRGHRQWCGGEWVARIRENPSLADQCDWMTLNGDDWRRLLKHCPQFADKCDWSLLDGRNWQRLLTSQPQFADHCDWSKLNAENRRGLLMSQPQFADKCDLSGVDGAGWLRLLHHCANSPQVTEKCDKWDQFSTDSVCDLLKEHPQLSEYCPSSVWEKFRLVHWAQLIRSGTIFADKMQQLGKDKLIGDGWCCLYHWAEEYRSFFVRYGAATPHDQIIQIIVERSAMNPENSHHYTLPEDVAKRIQWLSLVAADFAAAAALASSEVAMKAAEIAAKEEEGEETESLPIPSSWSAERYALIAEAANYEIQILMGESL